ncbi:hypothetical protein DYQ86_23115 [Acidobacteria bacterium AB60]|nr:hypothetical protein DYQ86_23115 [Acidobacteria bacterium AB60]
MRRAILAPMRGPIGCLGGCLVKFVLFALAACLFMMAIIVALNPWALHIGGQTTPLLTWQGVGTVRAEDGRTYPLYLSFSPGRPAGMHLTSRREGKRKSADLDGRGWLCLAPGVTERLKLSGTMYGGYLNTDDSLFDFRLLEAKQLVTLSPRLGGFFDLAGTFQGSALALTRPGEQGIRFDSGVFIHHATATLRPGSYEDFEAACRVMTSAH